MLHGCAQIDAIITSNVCATARLTHMVLPKVGAALPTSLQAFRAARDNSQHCALLRRQRPCNARPVHCTTHTTLSTRTAHIRDFTRPPAQMRERRSGAIVNLSSIGALPQTLGDCPRTRVL
jgi:hypothetical protein